MITEVKKALALEKSLHPKAEVQDYVKLVIQSCLGVAHLHIDEQESLRMLEEEKKQDCEYEADIQYIGNGLCRVPLSYMKTGQLPFWNLLFMATWKHGKQNPKQLEEAISYLCESYEVSEDLRKSAMQGVHHTTAYKSAYRPCYRVIKYAYIQYFEVLFFIWKQMQTKSANHIGIDGRCASGKSTVSTLITEVFHLHIFHMDDYFLPVSLRSEKRLAQVGGNVDYERFEKEIIESMMKQETTIYKRYDCQCDSFDEEITVPYQACTIWEGSYAHHPRFQAFLTARIFITCCEDVQKERLKKRSLTLFDRFVNEWIPMEETYFKTYSIQKQSDIVVDTSNY